MFLLFVLNLFFRISSNDFATHSFNDTFKLCFTKSPKMELIRLTDDVQSSDSNESNLVKFESKKQNR